MTIDRRSLSTRISPVVDNRSLAVYRRLPDGEHVFEATGFILDLGESAVLVSAGHALLSKQIGVIPFSSSSMWFRHQPVSDYRESSRNAELDIGTVLIDPDEREMLPKECLTPLSSLSTEPPTLQRRLYRAVGYRDIHQHADRAAGVYRNGESVLTVSEAAPPSYKHSRLDRRSLLLLGAKRRNLKGPRGTGGVPNWSGMSGCPVWMVPASAHSRLLAHPFVCGIFVGAPEHSRNLVVAIRVEALLSHLDRSYPDAGAAVRAAAS